MPDEKSLKDVTVWSGHREMSLEDVAVIQPGLGRLMPEIGARTWKLYYAAKAANWPLAKFQLKEIRGLMELAAFTRPKYEENLNQFLAEKWRTSARSTRSSTRRSKLPTRITSSATSPTSDGSCRSRRRRIST